MKKSKKKKLISQWNSILTKNADSNLSTGSTVSSLHDSIFFPIVQRVFAKTIAQDLVPVQPMSGPFLRSNMEKLEDAVKELKELIDDNYNESRFTEYYKPYDHIIDILSTLPELISKAIPGLTIKTIEELTYNMDKLEKQIALTKLGNNFGI